MTAGTKKLIVVIDDEPGLCDLLKDFLEDEGYEVRCVADGAQGLALLRSLERRPCMVLCDVVMPVMDGASLFAATRAEPRLCDIPFLFMTTDPSLAPPGQPVLRKPADFDAILRMARSCCNASDADVAM